MASKRSIVRTEKTVAQLSPAQIVSAVRAGVPTRKKGIPLAQPVAETLAEINETLGWPTNAEGAKWSQREFLITLRDAVTREPQTEDFQVVLSSVGNPDMGQYHRHGVASPTVIVSGQTLADLVKAHDAYVAIYNLGGGNCPTYRVFRKDVEVATISYNGRCWTPHEWGHPDRKEINAETGESIA